MRRPAQAVWQAPSHHSPTSRAAPAQRVHTVWTERRSAPCVWLAAIWPAPRPRVWAVPVDLSATTRPTAAACVGRVSSLGSMHLAAEHAWLARSALAMPVHARLASLATLLPASRQRVSSAHWEHTAGPLPRPASGAAPGLSRRTRRRHASRVWREASVVSMRRRARIARVAHTAWAVPAAVWDVLPVCTARGETRRVWRAVAGRTALSTRRRALGVGRVSLRPARQLRAATVRRGHSAG